MIRIHILVLIGLLITWFLIGYLTTEKMILRRIENGKSAQARARRKRDHTIVAEDKYSIV